MLTFLGSRRTLNGRPYSPANVLSSLYAHLGIDPASTIPDHNNRPMYVLDDRDRVRELE